MVKKIRGKGKLFNEDGSVLICDARYLIITHDDAQGMQYIGKATLDEITYNLLITLSEKLCVLLMDDGKRLDIQLMGLRGMPPDEIDFNIIGGERI